MNEIKYCKMMTTGANILLLLPSSSSIRSSLRKRPSQKGNERRGRVLTFTPEELRTQLTPIRPSVTLFMQHAPQRFGLLTMINTKREERKRGETYTTEEDTCFSCGMLVSYGLEDPIPVGSSVLLIQSSVAKGRGESERTDVGWSSEVRHCVAFSSDAADTSSVTTRRVRGGTNSLVTMLLISDSETLVVKYV
jgi:hypothetical protein